MESQRRERRAQGTASFASLMSPWGWRPVGEVLTVDFLKLAIDLGRKDALVPKTLEREAEPTEASEEVDEPHRRDASEGRVASGLRTFECIPPPHVCLTHHR